jgi:hypothetical protein
LQVCLPSSFWYSPLKHGSQAKEAPEGWLEPASNPNGWIKLQNHQELSHAMLKSAFTRMENRALESNLLPYQRLPKCWFPKCDRFKMIQGMDVSSPEVPAEQASQM